MHRRAACWAVGTALLLWTLVSPAGASARRPLEIALEPAPQNPAHLPYQTAVLRVANPAKVTVQGLAYRLAEGGPTFVDSEATFPPGQTEMTVPVPALAVRQEVVVTTGAGGEAGRQIGRATLNWPPRRVRADAFYDLPVYEDWGLRLGRWPGRSRWTVLALLAGMAAVVSACTTLRRAGARAAVVGVVVAGTCVGAWLWLDRPVVHSQRDPSRPIVIYTTQRASQVAGEGLPWPIYWGRRHFRSDGMTVSLRGGWVAPIDSHEARVFRLAEPPATAPVHR